MSEKRFALEYDSNCYKCISDNEQKKLYSSRESICDLLNQLNDKNEQLKDYFKKRAECSNFQINKLKEEIAELQEDNVDTIVELSKENKELGKNFEDLVDWASKIANRNVVLDEQIGELQRENEQLRKELNDCEKFRYQVFKRIGELSDE